MHRTYEIVAREKYIFYIYYATYCQKMSQKKVLLKEAILVTVLFCLANTKFGCLRYLRVQCRRPGRPSTCPSTKAVRPDRPSRCLSTDARPSTSPVSTVTVRPSCPSRWPSTASQPSRPPVDGGRPSRTTVQTGRPPLPSRRPST